MKFKHFRPRRIRKSGRKKSRTRIGWRVLLVYIVTLMIAGALATTLNLKMEDWSKAREAAPHGTP